MTNIPKRIGTKTETDFVRHAVRHGFDGAERLALHGRDDEGDVILCPDVIVEVKGGKAAETASDAQVAAWLVETETERRNRGAAIAFLVRKRKGKGAASVGQWHAHLDWITLARLGLAERHPHMPALAMTVDEALHMIRRCGFGDAL